MTAVGERLTPSSVDATKSTARSAATSRNIPVPYHPHPTILPLLRHNQGKAFHSRPSSSPPLLPFERACRRTRPLLTGHHAKIPHPVAPLPFPLLSPLLLGRWACDARDGASATLVGPMPGSWRHDAGADIPGDGYGGYVKGTLTGSPPRVERWAHAHRTSHADTLHNAGEMLCEHPPLKSDGWELGCTATGYSSR
jgi:hypothetical protein